MFLSLDRHFSPFHSLFWKCCTFFFYQTEEQLSSIRCILAWGDDNHPSPAKEIEKKEGGTGVIHCLRFVIYITSQHNTSFSNFSDVPFMYVAVLKPHRVQLYIKQRLLKVIRRLHWKQHTYNHRKQAVTIATITARRELSASAENCVVSVSFRI